MHKVFINYHHFNDQAYKSYLVHLGEKNSIFLDRSVDTGDISDHFSDQQIRGKIRDEYFRDSTVTIILKERNTSLNKKKKILDILSLAEASLGLELRLDVQCLKN